MTSKYDDREETRGGPIELTELDLLKLLGAGIFSGNLGRQDQGTPKPANGHNAIAKDETL